MDTLMADTLAASLQESKKALLAKVLRTIGQERCQAIFVEACAIEANGGMLTSAGDRRRTAGGTFFHLVRQQCTKQERARLFPYQASKKPPGQQAPATVTPPAPVLLTLDQWEGLTPMAVTATLKLVLRELPETRERDGMVYMALTNEPRGLPKGITLESGPLYLSSPVKQWKTACTRAEQIRTTGTPALLIVEAHVSTKEGALIGVVKGVQVVEGKAAAPQTQS